MRVEIDDYVAQRHMIDSTDPELIGRWFTEKATLLMSANAALGDCRLRIWPTTHTEHEILSGPDRLRQIDYRLTQDSLLELAQRILDASHKLAELEASKA